MAALNGDMVSLQRGNQQMDRVEMDQTTNSLDLFTKRFPGNVHHHMTTSSHPGNVGKGRALYQIHLLTEGSAAGLVFHDSFICLSVFVVPGFPAQIKQGSTKWPNNGGLRVWAKKTRPQKSTSKRLQDCRLLLLQGFNETLRGYLAATSLKTSQRVDRNTSIVAVV